MQDRYVADLGDFLKLGLLRWLVAASPAWPSPRLGVIWYKVPDEDGNADGKHVAYLREGHPVGRKLRELDHDLYDRLRSVHESGNRSIASLESSGALPPGSVTYSAPLSFRQFGSHERAQRAAHRRQWFDAGLTAVQESLLVFVDPDNGLRRTDHRVPGHRNTAEKHAYLDEIRRFTERGQSVVAYHHADRSAKVAVQAQRRMEDVAEQVGVAPIGAVLASRGTSRLFIVVPAIAHRVQLAERLDQLGKSPWGRELLVFPWNPAVVPNGGQPA
jgi:hypothetical protein